MKRSTHIMIGCCITLVGAALTGPNDASPLQVWGGAALVVLGVSWARYHTFEK